MSDKKYPIGTKIKFLWDCEDTGKTGTIVAYHGDGDPTIYLPTADKHVKRNSCTMYRGVKITWNCDCHEIEVLPQSGQLTFDFYKLENKT